MPVVPKSEYHIPFWGTIIGGLRIGKIIEIRGFIPSGGNVFDINLMNHRDSGSGSPSDKPLHISVRPSQQVVVRNDFHNGSWGNEERSGGFPFKMETQFLLLILVESSGYRIAVDCKHKWEFYHRLPYANVTLLHIGGAVRIDEIQYRDPLLDKGVMPYAQISCHTDMKPAINPPVPFYYPFEDGLRPGQMILINGRPTVTAKRFTINLICSRSPYPPPEDTAFHFDARINASNLVRNTKVNENWGREETLVPYFPFIPGVSFDLIIRVESDKFMVAINGQHFLEYRHRILPLLKTNLLNINGDVLISSVRFSYC